MGSDEVSDLKIEEYNLLKENPVHLNRIVKFQIWLEDPDIAGFTFIDNEDNEMTFGGKTGRLIEQDLTTGNKRLVG